MILASHFSSTPCSRLRTGGLRKLKSLPCKSRGGFKCSRWKAPWSWKTFGETQSPMDGLAPIFFGCDCWDAVVLRHLHRLQKIGVDLRSLMVRYWTAQGAAIPAEKKLAASARTPIVEEVDGRNPKVDLVLNVVQTVLPSRSSGGQNENNSQTSSNGPISSSLGCDELLQPAGSFYRVEQFHVGETISRLQVDGVEPLREVPRRKHLAD